MRDPATKKLGACFLLWAAALLLWEGAARSGAEGTFRLWPAAGFCLAAAALGTAACALPGRWRLVGATLFPLAYAYYGTQLVYAHVFGSYLTLAYVAVGGQAVGNFGGMVRAAIWACLPRLLVMAVPLAAFYLLRRRHILPLGERGQSREGLTFLAAGGCGLAALLLTLPLMGVGPGTPQAALVSVSATIDRRAEQLGLLPAGALDGWQALFGGRGVQVSGGGLDLTAGGRGPKNVLDGMDLETLAEGADDPDLEALSRYFFSLQGTAKNPYTGLFEGYNLIVVCAEAFSPYLIDPELTPALFPEAVRSALSTWGNTIPPVAAVSLLCVIRVKGKPIASFSAVTRTTPIGILLFVAAVVVLGTAVSSETTGISAVLSNLLAPVTSVLSPFWIVFFAILFCLILTNFISNTVSMMIFYSLTIPAIASTGISQVGVIIMITCAACFASLVPSAAVTAPFFFGDGHITVRNTFKWNLVMIFCAFVTIMGVMYPLAMVLL